MERDFMGLTKVKDEASEEPIDAAPVRSLAMQWSFSNKNSANNIPQMLLSFHGSQQEKRPKTGFDSLASNGLVSIITTSEKAAFQGSNLKPNHYSMHHPQTNQSNGFFPSYATSGHNLIVGSVKPPSDHVPGKAFVGTTGLRRSSLNNNNNSVAPVAQLTIFYNGSVCAYDNVSPEKAQAIMLLAGNGAPTTMASSSSAAAAKPVDSVQTCMSTTKSSVIEGLVLNHQPHATTVQLWPSPLPVNSVRVSNFTGQPGGNKNDPSSAKLGGGGVLVSPNSSISASATLFSSDTVPQFRKKSLARFLEKRKERVISSSPYGSKKSEDCSTPSEAVSMKSLCTNSSGSSSIPLPLVK